MVLSARTRQKGQALVELAMVFPVVLLAMFFMIAGLFYVFDLTTVSSDAQTAARLAAGIPTSGGSPNALDAVQRDLPGTLSAGLPATNVTYATSTDPNVNSCPPMSSITEPGHLVVCSRYAKGAVSGSTVIEVEIYGKLPVYVPWSPSLPVDEAAVVHSLGFSR